MEKLDLIKEKRAEAGRIGGKSKASAKAKGKHLEARRVDKSIVNKNTLKNNIDIRDAKFKKQVFEFANQYDKDLLSDFYSYWSEPNKTSTKMKYELKQTFDIKRRLVTWSNNDFGNNKSNGVSGFKKDANGKFWMGYCSKCNVSDFYDDIGIKQDSRCCQSKIMPEKQIIA